MYFLLCAVDKVFKDTIAQVNAIDSEAVKSMQYFVIKVT